MSDAPQKPYLYLKKPNLIKEWHPTKNGNLNPRNVTSEYNEKVWWICENGHEWEASIKKRVMGERCPVCLPKLLEEKVQKKYGQSKYYKRVISDGGTIHEKTRSTFILKSNQTHSTIEYRKNARYKAKATAIIENPISGDSIYGQMQNISVGGMYLETNAALKQGEIITIKFSKPLSFTRKRIFPSTVRWCKGLEDDEGYIDSYGLGIKFT